MSWLPSPERAADEARMLARYPGVGPANDPRSGLRDSAVVHRFLGPGGRPFFVVKRWIIGAFPGVLFGDPDARRFKSLKAARFWIMARFVYAVTSYRNQPEDTPDIVETWL